MLDAWEVKSYAIIPSAKFIVMRWSEIMILKWVSCSCIKRPWTGPKIGFTCSISHPCKLDIWDAGCETFVVTGIFQVNSQSSPSGRSRINYIKLAQLWMRLQSLSMHEHENSKFFLLTRLNMYTMYTRLWTTVKKKELSLRISSVCLC